MCNLYSSNTPASEMRRLFRIARDRIGNAPPLPAIFPRHSAPVVRLIEGERELLPMDWGFLVPQVSKKTGLPILPRAVNNTRDDNLNSGFWRDSFVNRRCLIPATSFCEARGLRPATYYWFALADPDPSARPGFAFAGIWRHWRGSIGGELVERDTFSMLTTGPNELVRPIHPDRMPVILSAADHEAWLSAPPEIAAGLLRPYPAEAMRIVRVGTEAREDPLG
jgi:putative SOS response-associated peptidase YedK